MAEYNKKWADLFPATIGNQNRPSAGVDNTLPYETDKFPQHMANDPVRYDKMNAVVSQSMSNDERLNEKIKRTSDDLAAHNKDPKAHATGISGNAATASKLLTPRTISLTGKATGSTSFDGSANASINVTSVNADTASKLSTARKINIVGDATGAANFDGSGDANISITVNESKHASNVTDAEVSPDKSQYNGSATVPAAGVIDSVKSKTGSSDLTNMNQMRSFIGSVYDGEKNWYNALSIRHRNGAANGSNFGLLMYSKLSDVSDTIHYKKQNQGWTEERTLLDSSNYNSYAPTKTGAGASGTWPISITGNAATATADSNGDKIDDTYLKKATVIDVIYPVGSIYMSMVDTDPATLFGVGTWARISQGRMLLGADDSTYKAGATGGEATHTLTAAEMPAHSHTGTTSTNGKHTHGVRDADYHDGYGNSFDSGDWGPKRYIQTTGAGDHNHTFTTDNAGGGAAHNNMPPYLVCYIWQRTA